MPDAQCTRSLVCEKTNTRVSHHGHTGIPGIPRAMVYGLLRALPGDRAFLSPSPLRSLLLTSLTPTSRRQNHTTSPSASRALVSSAIRVHRILSRVRDDLEPPPLWDRTGRVIKVIWVFGKSEYFCKGGWTGFW